MFWGAKESIVLRLETIFDEWLQEESGE